MFDRVVCISLRRRQDRRDAFLSRIPSDWPWREIEIVDAVDGKLCRPPEWWSQGGGAWGCYKSHLNIVEQAVNVGLGSVLILEDDVTFAPDFARRAIKYFDSLPEGWGQAYLGGQHLVRPEFVNELVVRAGDINRTHAYALSGSGNIQECYRWLCNTDGWPKKHHVDHHYGQMHRRKIIPAYAPSEWLCGQSADPKSDVCWKEVKERWWHAKRSPLPQQKGSGRQFVAVVGLHRSGSSCVAMILHKLGVSMGDKLGGYESRNGGGGEAVGLAAICERAAKFPSTSIRDPAACEKRLAGWIRGRMKKVGGICGGKYPHLCAMGEMLSRIVGDGLLVINCDRPFYESVESLRKRSRLSRGWLAATDEQCERVQRWLWDEKQKFLSSRPRQGVLDVEHRRLLENPAAVVSEIVEFLGIRPTEDQFSAAVSHVKKEEAAVG